MTMIGVYADWEGLPEPKRLGFLHSRKTRATEVFEFQYDPIALADPAVNRIQIDPALGLFDGPQYPGKPHDRFGVFSNLEESLGIVSCGDAFRRNADKHFCVGVASNDVVTVLGAA